jgi:hypothetical protein
MESTSQLVWAMLFGSIGVGFFVYGKKQKVVMPLVAGIALLIFPYFIPNVYFMVIVGVALLALPYFFRF